MANNCGKSLKTSENISIVFIQNELNNRISINRAKSCKKKEIIVRCDSEQSTLSTVKSSPLCMRNNTLDKNYNIVVAACSGNSYKRRIYQGHNFTKYSICFKRLQFTRKLDDY